MAGLRYRCPEHYRCQCIPNALVSLSTVRRHRDIAQARLRLSLSNMKLFVPLPPPFFSGTTEEEHSELYSNSGSESFRSISQIAIEIEEPNIAVGGGDVALNSFSSEASGIAISGRLSNSQSWHSEDNEIHEVENHLPDLTGMEADCDEVSSDILTTSTELPAYFPIGPDFPIESERESLSKEDGDHSSNHSTCSDKLILSAQENTTLMHFLNSYGWYCGYSLRFNQTYAAMNALLERQTPGDTTVWLTVRNRLTAYSGIHVSEICYCSRFHEALQVDDTTGILSSCSHIDCAKCPAPIKTIPYIRVWERLKVKLQNPKEGPELLSFVKNNFNRQVEDDRWCYEDFYSGAGFREYSKQLEGFGNHDGSVEFNQVEHLFLFLSTDGAPAFNSSMYSFWPVILYIGNIPPDRRYACENVLPVLCVPGNPKDLESFLLPLLKELEELNEGMECVLWDGRAVVVKVHLLFVLADLQAMRKLCLIKGVNGLRPCRLCEIEGVYKPEARTMYYPDQLSVQKRNRSGLAVSRKQTLWDPNNLPMRSSDAIRDTFEQLAYLRRSGTSADVNFLTKSTGIIGEPLILKHCDSLKPFSSMPIDLMHLLFENVAPQMVSIWVGDIETYGEHSYLKSQKVLRSIDAVLQESGTGIDDSVRRPRGLRIKGMWKAEEWRTFITKTSMAVLDQFLPREIMDGWSKFVQICITAMHPRLSQTDLEDLKELCVSFFKHYSKTYYGGRTDRLHLMKYTIHLMLHIPFSTEECGPLVCLSQFSTERYIGVVKESTHARTKFAESVAQRWIFEQALYMCESMCSIRISNLKHESDHHLIDKRTQVSVDGNYKGYWLRGPRRTCTVLSLTDEFCVPVGSKLARLYQSDLHLSRSEAQLLVESTESLVAWDRLFIRREDEWEHRKYGKFVDGKHTRSRAYLAAEFHSPHEGDTDVYFGEVLTFLEHTFKSPNTGKTENRILLMARWVTRGLKLGRHKQVYASGPRSKVFTSVTIEDVSCIRRHISVVEVPQFKSKTKPSPIRTYFIDEDLTFDKLLNESHEEGSINKRLRGFS